MPRIIFRCPYLKGGSEEAAAHLENYVGYVATREGVERIDPGRALLPATQKQRTMVQKLLREFPLSKGMIEYQDYLAAPTRDNASEFITRAIEDNLDSLAKRENYLEYIAKRPRAQRMGPHGLFTGAEDALVLSRVAKEVAEHQGNVWLPIISLRRKDAARLGYDSAGSWRALLSSYAPEMAKAMKIPWDQFRWYAAYHDEGHHPHVHMVCYSADPSKGYLTKDGIAKIKADLAGQIFRQELTELYTRQTQRRTELATEAQAVMERLIRQMQTGVLENKRIEQLTAHLAERLRFTAGKKQYGYLKAPLKSVVDEIVDELAKDSRVAEAYRLWYELRDEVLRTYRSDLPEHLPLSQQKEFKKIKNLVIQETMRLGTLAELQEAEPEVPLPEEPPELPTEESPQWEEPPLPDAPPPEDPPPDLDEPEAAEPSVSWSDRYKRARQLLYGGEDRPPDFERAYALFLEEARSGNALAMHDLGRMFLDGLAPGGEIDTEQAQAWYTKALAAFLAVEEEKPGRYTEYRIGKLYAAGLGTEQDHSAAAGWFALAAEQGHKYAQYSLAGLYSRGQGVGRDDEEAHRLYAASAEQDFPYAAFELGKQFRDGVGCEANGDSAELWFTQAYDGFRALEKQSHDDKLQYRIGWMHLRGVGAGQDEQAARTWFERAARLGNPHAQYQLAKLILADPAATPEQVAEALSWLTKAAEAGQDCAQYALGKLYRDGRGDGDGGPMEKDVGQAVAWFTKAAEQDNSYAAFALGKLYLEGMELPKDIPAALHWLHRSAGLGNQFAQYRLGKLLLTGEDIPKDVETAVRWLTTSAEQGNQFAQYALGRLYLKGEEVPRDPAAAIRWLESAAAQGNAFAEYALGMVYLKGEDVPKDLKKALTLLTHSAEQGNQYAQYRLGKLLLSGEGVPKDVEAAVRWLTASAEQGNQFAQYTLGKLYLLGRDVPRDKEAAARWFTLAAEQGNEYAQYFLDHIDDPFGPSLLQTATRLLHHLGNIFRDQSPPPSGSGGMQIAVDKKLLRKIREKKMAQGHKADDHEPTMTL